MDPERFDMYLNICADELLETEFEEYGHLRLERQSDG